MTIIHKKTLGIWYIFKKVIIRKIHGSYAVAKNTA